MLATALLLTALVAPVALFLVLRSRLRWGGLAAAGVAVATGWALNVAWALASREGTAQGPPPADADFVSIAASFGWACPAVLVLLTWLAGRLLTRRTA